MMYMNISALTMEEAEAMLKTLDRWLRHFYNVDGVHRVTSFNRRANDGFRAQIRVQIEKEMWDYVKNGVMSDVVHQFNKAVSYHVEHVREDFRVLEFATAEATI